MTLCEQAIIRAPVEAVWKILAVPTDMTRWNPKCVRVDVHDKEMRIGLRYPVQMRLRSKEIRMECEVLHYEAPRRLALRFRRDHLRGDRYVDESFELALTSPSGLTKLVQRVDFTRSAMPWIIQLILKIVSQWGRPVGPSTVDRLKELAEAGENPVSAG